MRCLRLRGVSSSQRRPSSVDWHCTNWFSLFLFFFCFHGSVEPVDLIGREGFIWFCLLLHGVEQKRAGVTALRFWGGFGGGGIAFSTEKDGLSISFLSRFLITFHEGGERGLISLSRSQLRRTPCPLLDCDWEKICKDAHPSWIGSRART